MSVRIKSLRSFKGLIDYWSVPHFLLGMLVALSVRVFGLPTIPFFIATLGIAILWEYFEMFLHIRELKLNVLSDTIVPLLAYVFTLWLTDHAMRPEQQAALLITTIIFYVLVSSAAWQARLSRDPDFLN